MPSFGGLNVENLRQTAGLLPCAGLVLAENWSVAPCKTAPQSTSAADLLAGG